MNCLLLSVQYPREGRSWIVPNTICQSSLCVSVQIKFRQAQNTARTQGRVSYGQTRPIKDGYPTGKLGQSNTVENFISPKQSLQNTKICLN